MICIHGLKVGGACLECNADFIRELERQLRQARRLVFENDEYTQVIQDLKTKLKPFWDAQHHQAFYDALPSWTTKADWM